MEKFEVNILGCGSALPTVKHYPSAQVVNIREKLFLVDCGEGAQLQFRRMKLKFSRISHIFLSHLHGDHCFGLPGLISTLGLAGCTEDITIHAHPDAERIFRPILEYFCKELPFQVHFEALIPHLHQLIYEDKSVSVYTIPLKHRVPTCGFLFEEKVTPRHLLPDMIGYYDIPHYELLAIRNGADFTTAEGDIIANDRLTKPGPQARRYAYCCDTAYSEKIIPYIEGVDMLYHDTTFGSELKKRAKSTFHTTAAQAAILAQKAQVKQLLLGHFSSRYISDEPLLEEAKTIFPNSQLAKELALFSL